MAHSRENVQFPRFVGGSKQRMRFPGRNHRIWISVSDEYWRRYTSKFIGRLKPIPAEEVKPSRQPWKFFGCD
jgi:hypothetical protein